MNVIMGNFIMGLHSHMHLNIIISHCLYWKQFICNIYVNWSSIGYQETHNYDQISKMVSIVYIYTDKFCNDMIYFLYNTHDIHL